MPNTFCVAVQHTGRYDVHIFENKNHFTAWMKVHPTQHVLRITHASGRKGAEYNHIGEIDYDVADMRLTLQFGR